MGNGAIVYRGMGYRGDGAYGQWGHRDMRYRGMSNRVQGYGAYWQWGTGGKGHMGNGSHGQWDTGGMGHMAMRPTGGYGYRGMGTGGMGYKGYGPCGQWDTGLWATWAMGPMGDLLPKYQKMSSCQKDVKLSKRCQMSKNQTPRLWRRFTKKLN